MKIRVPHRIEMFGCGTVGYWTVQELARSPVAKMLECLTLRDLDEIGKENATTCPLYDAAHIGEAKVERLAEIAKLLFPRRMRIRALRQDVRGISYRDIVEDDRGPGPPAARIAAVLGLDDWNARVSVIRHLRHAAPAPPPRTPR